MDDFWGTCFATAGLECFSGLLRDEPPGDEDLKYRRQRGAVSLTAFPSCFEGPHLLQVPKNGGGHVELTQSYLAPGSPKGSRG